MILHYPTNALEKLEEVSYLLRKGMDLDEHLKLEEIRTYTNNAVDELPYIDAVSKHFPKPPQQTGEEEAEAAEEAGPVG
jgi:hypothetical protein